MVTKKKLTIKKLQDICIFLDKKFTNQYPLLFKTIIYDDKSDAIKISIEVTINGVLKKAHGYIERKEPDIEYYILDAQTTLDGLLQHVVTSSVESEYIPIRYVKKLAIPKDFVLQVRDSIDFYVKQSPGTVLLKDKKERINTHEELFFKIVEECELTRDIVFFATHAWDNVFVFDDNRGEIKVLEEKSGLYGIATDFYKPNPCPPAYIAFLRNDEVYIKKAQIINLYTK